MVSRHKGFTLSEIMISMVVLCILLAVSAPLITKFSILKIGINQNVMKCIVNNSSTDWYNTDGFGATTLPATDPCKTAVIDVQQNRNNALVTSISTADNGTADQKTMAKRILRAACDKGGAGACDYFINTCLINGHGAIPYCDDTSDYTDITYYLQLNRITYTNNGASYISNQVTTLLPKMPVNSANETVLLQEVINDVTSGTNPNNNIATNLHKPYVYIQACNNGFQSACEYAYNNNYNKSCYQVKTNWQQASTQDYKLTYNSAGAIHTESVNCNMINIPSAVVTGCNNISSNLLTNAPNDDCTVGYNNNYNNSCSQIASVWSSAPTGNYNLTTSSIPTYTSTPCDAAQPVCVTNGPGTVCSDGTVYAGQYNGYYYYIPPTDQGQYSWATFPINTNTGAFDADNGSNNTDLLHNLSNPPDLFAPYKAANVCYDATDFGYDDWYLPARRELVVFYTNKLAINNFYNTGYYWSSTESNYFYAVILNFANNNQAAMDKWNSYYVRCARKKLAIDDTCPNPGDTCSDGTKYAGSYSTYYLYTTPFDKGIYTWNNGDTLGTNTNALNFYYGMPNFTKLANLTDAYAPYNAALACKSLNDSSAYGYTDWYLPARYELINALYANRAAIGTFALTNYWSSTESSKIQAYYRGFDVNSIEGGSNKNNMYRVRCVRRST